MDAMFDSQFLRDFFRLDKDKGFRAVNCAKCGIRFGLPRPYAQHKIDTKGIIFCPNGDRMQAP